MTRVEMNYMSRFANGHSAISKVRGRSVASRSESTSSPDPVIAVIFRGSGVLRVTGADTQQVYCFSELDPEQMIDAKDAATLLKTGLFRLRD
jgi:hypothetical protein